MEQKEVYLKKPTWLDIALGFWSIAVLLFLAVTLFASVQEWRAMEISTLNLIVSLCMVLPIFGVMLLCAEGCLSTLEFSSSGIRVLLWGRELRRYPREKMGLFCHAYAMGGRTSGPSYHVGIILLPPEQITERRKKEHIKGNPLQSDLARRMIQPDWERRFRREYLERKSKNVLQLRTRDWLFLEENNAMEMLAVLHYLYPEVPVEDYAAHHQPRYVQTERQPPVMPLRELSNGGKINITAKGITVTRWGREKLFWPAAEIRTMVRLNLDSVSSTEKQGFLLVVSPRTKEQILASNNKRRDDWYELLNMLPDYQERLVVKQVRRKEHISMRYTPGLAELIQKLYPHIVYIPFPTFQEGKE